jgi:tRNA nucleotidyltransferase (CCA-adding enzyme)
MRDALLSRIPKDWDITTSAKPTDVQRLFEKTIPTGIQHGTVTVMIDGEGYEVTTFRGEGAYSDGRRPDEIYFLTDVREDLARRDFTINAIAGDPLTDNIIDPFDGQGDLKRKLIKAVGDPRARFAEDGLRTLRACRFASMLEFAIDPVTANTIPYHISTFLKVSPERVFDEVSKMLMRSLRPSVGFRAMLETGLLEVVLPEIAAGYGMDQGPYHEFDVFGHTMRVVDYTPVKLTLKLAGLLHDSGKPQQRTWSDKKGHWIFYSHDEESAKIADRWLKRMRVSNDIREEVVKLVAEHMVMYNSSWTDASVRRWIKRVGVQRVSDLLDLHRADVAGQGNVVHVPSTLLLADELQARATQVLLPSSGKVALDVNAVAVSGDDIIQILGIKPGKTVGLVKKALLEIVLDRPELNTREQLEPLVIEIARRL